MLSFMEWNPNMIIGINTAGEITYLNLAARAQFPDIQIKKMEHPFLVDLENQMDNFTKSTSSIVVFNREIVLNHRTYEEQIFGIPEQMNIFIYITDITDRKDAENKIVQLNKTLEQRVIKRTEQLSAMNKELESFSYSISHDLRAPLRTIEGFTQVLLDEYETKLDEVGKHILSRINNALHYMETLIDDILELSHLSHQEMHPVKVNLSDIAEEIMADLIKAEPKRIVEYQIEKGLIVKGDKRLLKIMLFNLLGNAWKFSGKNTITKIEFGKTIINNTTTYFIRDYGAGFDMTYVNKLFNTFERLHTQEEFPGTGIGLSIVSRIINRHQGKIWAEAIVGKGATFYFVL